MAVGVTVLSYVAALAFTVLFEIPYCTISSEILKLKKKPSSATPPLSPSPSTATIGAKFVEDSIESTLIGKDESKKID